MQRIRHAIDGSIFIPRADPEQERELDAQFVRINGELRWWPIPLESRDDAADWVGRYTGRRAIVLGKGPSLDRLPELELSTGDVIAAVNEAALSTLVPRIDLAVAVDIHVVKRLAAEARRGTVYLAPPGTADAGPEVFRAIGSGIFDAQLRSNSGASPVLIRMLRVAGISSLVLFGFDGLSGPGRGAVYAPSIRGMGVKDRESWNFGDVNATITAELSHWPELAVTMWHKIPKPAKRKGP